MHNLKKKKKERTIWGLLASDTTYHLSSSLFPHYLEFGFPQLRPTSLNAPWSLMLLFSFISSLLFHLIKNPKFLKNLFYWSVADLQCCVNFCCTAKWLRYIYIHSFSYSFPLWFNHKILNIVPWTLFFIHSIYKSLHLLILNSQSFPSHALATTRLFSMSVSPFLFRR